MVCQDQTKYVITKNLDILIQVQTMALVGA